MLLIPTNNMTKLKFLFWFFLVDFKGLVHRQGNYDPDLQPRQPGHKDHQPYIRRPQQHQLQQQGPEGAGETQTLTSVLNVFILNHRLAVGALSQWRWNELMLVKCQINTNNTNKNEFLLSIKCVERVLKYSYLLSIIFNSLYMSTVF